MLLAYSCWNNSLPLDHPLTDIIYLMFADRQFVLNYYEETFPIKYRQEVGP